MKQKLALATIVVASAALVGGGTAFATGTPAPAKGSKTDPAVIQVGTGPAGNFDCAYAAPIDTKPGSGKTVALPAEGTTGSGKVFVVTADHGGKPVSVGKDCIAVEVVAVPTQSGVHAVPQKAGVSAVPQHRK